MKRIALCCFFVMVMTGCASIPQTGMTPVAPEGLEARFLVKELENDNKDLLTFKGLGTVRLKENRRFLTLRMAWMGESPEKFRIETLSVSGQPVASLAGDGRWLYFLSYPEHRFYKKGYDSGFNTFLSIPVSPVEMIALLGGRIPIVKHHSADLIRDPDSSGYVLILKKRWQGVVEKIYLNSGKDKVLKIERFDSQGALLYWVIRNSFQEISNFKLPFWIQASDNDGSFFELSVERCWINIPLDLKGFIITPKIG